MRTIHSVLSFLRVKEWYDSKVPFILCYPLTMLVLNPGQYKPLQMLLILLVALFFSSLFLAYGYVINDYADLECDRAAGKKKVIQGMTKPVIFICLAALVLSAAVLPLIYCGLSLNLFWALAGTYLLGSTYSLPPLRFKERGVLGLLVSSFAQRCMPLLVIALMLPEGHRDWLGFFLTLSFISGLRYIFIHQMIDLENDCVAGVQTFARTHPFVVRVGIYVTFALELVGLAVIATLLHQPIIWVGLLFGLISEWIQSRALVECLHKPVFTSFVNVPLEGLENIVLPISLVVSLAMNDKLLWWFCVLLTAYLLPSITRRLLLMRSFLVLQWHRLNDNTVGI